MDNDFPGAVEFISYLGSQVDLHVRLSPKERVIRADPEPAGTAAAGDRATQVRIGWTQVDRPRLSIVTSLPTNARRRKS